MSERTNTSSVTLGESTLITNPRDPSANTKLIPILQILSGADRGRLISLQQHPLVRLGRSKSSELVIYDPSCSRNHAEIHSAETVVIRDLNSTNGTRVNGTKLKGESVTLNDGDRIQLGDNTFLRFLHMPEQDFSVQMDVFYRATRDALTKACNRHQFDDALSRELAAQKRMGYGLGVIAFDVDHFKKVNDSFGHAAGDEVLRAIGERVPHCIRTEDMFARVGGEEFIVLARTDDADGLRRLAERIRVSMEAEPVEFESQKISFTVSVGLSWVSGKSVSDAPLVSSADEALYEAKRSGRNRTISKLVSNPESA